MNRSSRLVATMAGGLALLVAGCDADPTALDSSPSAVLLQSTQVNAALSPALLSVSGKGGPGNGQGRNKVDLSTVAAVEVQIERISLRIENGEPVDTADAKSDESEYWVDVELTYDPETFFDLRDLSSAATLGLVPEIASGEISAVRLYFGDARVVFVDGTEEALFIPSGKVTIPTEGVVINQGEDVSLIFATGTSIRKIKRTGQGLLMPPVFRVMNDVEPADLDDDDGTVAGDDGEETGDDSGEEAGDDSGEETGDDTGEPTTS